jgi:hypothetical protein
LTRRSEVIKWLFLRFEFFLFFGTLALTLLHSWWWLLSSVPLAVWCATQVAIHWGRPWRRFHFPASRDILPKALAIETHEASQEGRVFDEKRMLEHLVTMASPRKDYTEARLLVEAALSDEALERNQVLLCNEIRRRVSKKVIREHRDLVENSAEQLEVNRAKLKKLFVMAVLVGERYGEKQRGEYIYQSLKGEAF